MFGNIIGLPWQRSWNISFTFVTEVWWSSHFCSMYWACFIVPSKFFYCIRNFCNRAKWFVLHWLKFVYCTVIVFKFIYGNIVLCSFVVTWFSGMHMSCSSLMEMKRGGCSSSCSSNGVASCSMSCLLLFAILYIIIKMLINLLANCFESENYALCSSQINTSVEMLLSLARIDLDILLLLSMWWDSIFLLFCINIS